MSVLIAVFVLSFLFWFCIAAWCAPVAAWTQRDNSFKAERHVWRLAFSQALWTTFVAGCLYFLFSRANAQTMPPMPPRSFKSVNNMKGGERQMELSKTSRKVKLYAVVLPPRVITLKWCYPVAMPDPDTIFEIWHSFDLVNWTMSDVTDKSPYYTANAYPREFFKVRPSLQGNTGDWGSTIPCP